METSFYFYYLITNRIADVEIFYNTTVRDLLEPGLPNFKLNDLNITQAENHLGLSCLLVDDNNNILIGIRNNKVNVFRDALSPTISGAANLITCSSKNIDDSLSPLYWLQNEMNEELFLDSNDDKIKNFIYELTTRALFLGISRELMRLGKPEVFFAIQLTNRDTQFLKQHLLNLSQNKNESIDQNENKDFLWINIDSIVREYKYKNDDYFITHSKEEYKLSESLIVNILLYLEYTSSNTSQQVNNE